MTLNLPVRQALTPPLAALTDVDLAGIVDGQHLAYRASDDKIIPATPSGAAEWAYAENATGTVTGPVAGASGGFAAGGAIAVPSSDITVAVTTRPVYLDALGVGAQTTLGAGLGILEIWETTSGTPTFYSRNNGRPLPNKTNADARRNFDVRIEPIRVGPVASQRTFQLRINCFGDGATPAWQLLNLNAAGFRSWLRAMVL